MPAHVLLITSRDEPAALLPAGHTLSDVRVTLPDRALRHIADQRARGNPVVAVIDTTAGGVQSLVADCAVKYPEVPVILAVPADASGGTPSSAMRKPAGSAALLDAIQNASRTAAQQARVRTTLDRINVRLRPTATSTVADERQHRRLLLSGLYLSGILEQARDAIFIADRPGVVALWNRGAEQLFGVASSDIVGRRIDQLGPALGGPELLCTLGTLSHDVPVAEQDLSFTPPGGPRVARVSLSLIRDEDGTGVAVCGIIHDVTEREQLLRDVQQQAAALAISNRHKEEFLAVLSHELRTPLNAVLGWAHMLQTMPHDPERVRDAATRIARNGQVQQRLVSDLLDFARITAGTLTLRVAPGNLTAVVREAVDALRPEVQARGLTLDEHYEDGIVMPIDADRVGQVVTNLVSNAVKFTPAGGRITVTLGRTSDGCELSVQDTGRGIAPDFLPHVFDAFRQADASTKGSQGLGLGLAIVCRIVEQHGGTIRAASEGPGAGATFTVVLPDQNV